MACNCKCNKISLNSSLFGEEWIHAAALGAAFCIGCQNYLGIIWYTGLQFFSMIVIGKNVTTSLSKSSQWQLGKSGNRETNIHILIFLKENNQISRTGRQASRLTFCILLQSHKETLRPSLFSLFLLYSFSSVNQPFSLRRSSIHASFSSHLLIFINTLW